MAWQPVCDTPTLFHAAHEVCGQCGNLLAQHDAKPPETLRTLAALWATMLRYGVVHSYYGGADQYKTDQLRAHMGGCSVDLNAVHEPNMGTVYEFADTDADSNQIMMLQGDLTCACGYLSREQLVIDDMTFGQLLWHTLNDRPMEQTPGVLTKNCGKDA